MSDPLAPSWLCLRIDPLEPRFHGTPDWPPSPARAFQALVAAAGQGRDLEERHRAALRWLERLPSPRVGAPQARRGRTALFHVPNNDLDAFGGVPSRVENVRVEKGAHVRLLAEGVPYFYVWLAQETEHAECLREIALDLNQFGRGIDGAYASMTVLDRAAFDDLSSNYEGLWYEPGSGSGSVSLSCPSAGSLAQLEARFYAARTRLQTIDDGRRQYFSQPPMAVFSQVHYGGHAWVESYDLVPESGAPGQLAAWPLSRAHDLVTNIRDQLLEALRPVVEDQSCLDQVVLGRDSATGNYTPAAHRLQLLPIPSIGHEHVRPRIRRLGVRFPERSKLDRDDIRWALGRCELEASTSTVHIAPSTERSMAQRYFGTASRWNTITPVALTAARRRIDPTSKRMEKGGAERESEEVAATDAIKDALRHAGVRQRTQEIRVQREPYGVHGTRAEAFARGSRFQKETLWHVSISFTQPVRGPLAIGNGRFLGLGIMHPVLGRPTRLVAFHIREGLAGQDPERARAVGHALRRAVMSRFQSHFPHQRLPEQVSGHRDDGAPSQDQHKIAYSCDLERGLLLVFSSAPSNDQTTTRIFGQLEQALADFRVLRAASAGKLQLEAAHLSPDDRLVRPSRTWFSISPYTVNRYCKADSVSEAIKQDVQAACVRAGLPRPHVSVETVLGSRSAGRSAMVRLEFSVAVQGPLVLGKSRYQGGGLFGAC